MKPGGRAARTARRRPEGDFATGPVAVVGLGLIGGGMVRGLRAARPNREILVVEPDAETRAAVRRARLATEVLPEITAAIGAARVVVIATPLAAVDSVLARLATHIAPEALLTDVVGIKLPMAELVARHLPDIAYVGAHPMAGGARGGFANSRADMFRGSTVGISPGPRASAAQVAAIRALWRTLEANPVDLSAEDHDRAVALTSHLPYAIGLALDRLAADRTGAARLAGPSFHDMTKRVLFAPEVMAAVVASNPFIADTLRALAGECGRLADLIAARPAALVTEAVAARGRHLTAAARRANGAPAKSARAKPAFAKPAFAKPGLKKAGGALDQR